MKLIPLLILVAFLTQGSMPVHAQELVCPKPTNNQEENKNEARRYYNMGNTYFNMKQFDKSAASFVCVINLVPYSIMARYRLALSYDNLGKYSLAREQLQWVLADASEEAKPLKTDAQKRFDQIKDLPDKGAVVVKPPVDPAAEKARLAVEAEKARIAAEAEKARIEVENRKKADAEKARLAAEKQKRDDAEKARLAAEARKKAADEKAARDAKNGSGEPVVPAAPKLTSRWWFWTGVGATAVFTGAAVFFGMKTLDARDKWETDWNPEDRSALEDNRLFTDLSIGGAVISAAALGVTLWLTRPKKIDDAKTGWTIVPACGPEGCMMTFSLGF